MIISSAFTYSSKSCDLKQAPLSLTSVCGSPNMANTLGKILIVTAEVIAFVRITVIHLVYVSTRKKRCFLY